MLNKFVVESLDFKAPANTTSNSFAVGYKGTSRNNAPTPITDTIHVSRDLVNSVKLGLSQRITTGEGAAGRGGLRLPLPRASCLQGRCAAANRNPGSAAMACSAHLPPSALHPHPPTNPPQCRLRH